MRFYERFCSSCALSIIGKCTSRHLFAYGGFNRKSDIADFKSDLFRVARSFPGRPWVRGFSIVSARKI